MDFNYLIQEGHNYSLMNVSDASYVSNEVAVKLRSIVANAYPYITLEEVRNLSGIKDLSVDDAIAGAQAAIWHFANGYNFSMEGNVKTLHDFYLTIANVSGLPTDISEINVTYDTYYEEGKRNLFINVSGKDLENYNYEFDKDLEEEYGLSIKKVKNGLILENIIEDISFNLKVSASQKVLEDVYFFNPDGGRTASQSLIGIESGNINVAKNLDIKVTDSFYDVTITKKDSVTLESLTGVKFQISNTKDFSNFAYEGTTDENGMLIFKNIQNGTWYIKEVEGLEGYKELEIKTIEVNGKDVSLTILNDPLGKIKIVKEDENGIKLDGVEFDLYKDNVDEKNLINSNLVTDEMGEILIENLDEGKYILVETKAKEGYILNEENVFLKVEHGKTITKTIVNESIGTGNLFIKKIDSETEKFLKGAKIAIFKDENCTDLYLEVTSKNKILEIKDIPSGTYYVKEIKAPKGYILNLDVYKVEINKNSNFELIIKNYKIYDTGLGDNKIYTFPLSSFICYFGYKICTKKRLI